jgi:diguanylate cyclase (GGDEF)-like protein
VKTSGERPAGSRNRPPQIAGVLSLVQELTRLVHSDSPAELFGRAFSTLAGVIPFDVGVAVMLEQNLDLYISARPDAGQHISDALAARVRTVLRSVIPPEFTSTEIVVKDDRRTLPVDSAIAGIDYAFHATLTQETRTAGIVLICRSDDDFDEDERRVVEIFAAQLSMLLDNLRARAKIISLADMDELTGIPNRRFFRRQLTYELGRARVYNVPLSVLVIDVDDFKSINDTFGHVMGDVVLSELCGTIKSTLRTPDNICRFGGDEFAVILPHTDSVGAAAVSDRILERVRIMRIHSEEESDVRCTVSIGLAQSDASDESIDDIVRRADACLYDAKRQGKNRYNL